MHAFICHLSDTYLSDPPDSPARYASTAVVPHARARDARRPGGNGRARCCLGWLVPGRIGRPPGPRLTSMGRVVVRVAAQVASLACSTALDGSSSSIASASIADSRSSGTLLGEAFSATRAHTAHRHRNGGRPVLSAVRRKGAGAWRLAYLILCPCVACAHSASGGYTPLRTQWPQQQKARQGTGRGGAASVGDRTRPKPTTFGRKWTRPGRPDLELILRPSTPSCVVECCQSMCAGSRSSPPLEMRIFWLSTELSQLNGGE